MVTITLRIEPNFYYVLRVTSDQSIWIKSASGPVSDWVKLAPIPGGIFGAIVGFAQSVTGLGSLFIFIEDQSGCIHRLQAQVISPVPAPNMIIWQGWESMGNPSSGTGT